MSAILVEGLSKTYGTLKALDDLNLSIDTGVVFGFLGPNGAGKTTTLRILAGLSNPTSGQVWIEGEPVGPESSTRRRIGYLPEDPSFYPWMRAREFLVDLIGGLYGLARREAKSRANELLELVGLEEVAERRIAGFSRGMRQRLGLAQALMNKPSVLLLDEPVSALDPAGRHNILALIEKLGEDVTVFMSTHILNDVDRICDRIGILDRGHLVALDGREDLLERYATPVVDITFDARPESVLSWADSLKGLPFVKDVKVSGSSVRIMLDGLKQSNEKLQRLTLEADLMILSYQHVKPRLEDIFLRLVG
jgi:ABC-2 type transport system ATP-binding protein